MSAATTWLNDRVKIAPADRLPYALMAAWIMSMILLPIARWVYGDAAVPVGVAVTTLLQFSAVLSLLLSAWDTRRLLLTVVMAVVVAWFSEYVGSHTGFPFGDYTYTERLQPQLGTVPLLVPLAWLMMLPSAWAVAHCLVPQRSTLRGRLAFIGMSALAFTAWDLFLDPQMVGWGFWEWANPVGYFGIPWVNFLGWLLVSAVITALAQPKKLPVQPLLLIYGITWALQTIGQIFFWGLPGPGLVGGVVMGSFLLLALRAYRD